MYGFEVSLSLYSTVRAVVLEIGTAESVSLISKNHWKSGHPVSLISNLGSPNCFLRRQRRRQRGLPKTESQSSVVQGEGDGHQASEWEGGQRALYQQLRSPRNGDFPQPHLWHAISKEITTPVPAFEPDFCQTRSKRQGGPLRGSRLRSFHLLPSRARLWLHGSLREFRMQS